MNPETKEETLPEEETAQAPTEETDESLMDTLEEEVEAEEAAKPEEPEAAPEEEAKPRKRKKKEEEEEFVEEKTYTIPLGKALIMPPRKRAPRAMRMVKAYVTKHMKIPTRAEEEDEAPPELIILNEAGCGIEGVVRFIDIMHLRHVDQAVD